MPYSLGAVKPWVKDAAYEVGEKFDIATIYGVGARANVSDHPKGLALDYMVNSDSAKGDSIAGYLKQNWGRLSISYIIWKQRIDDGNGWEAMEDRGGITANHFDHVHASFNTGPSGPSYSGNITEGTDSSGDESSISAGLSQLTSAATWVRVLEFLAGVAIILAVAWEVINIG